MVPGLRQTHSTIDDPLLKDKPLFNTASRSISPTTSSRSKPLSPTASSNSISSNGLLYKSMEKLKGAAQDSEASLESAKIAPYTTTKTTEEGGPSVRRSSVSSIVPQTRQRLSSKLLSETTAGDSSAELLSSCYSFTLPCVSEERVAVEEKIRKGKSLLIYICNFHVLSNLLLIYICKLHWNLNTMLSRGSGAAPPKIKNRKGARARFQLQRYK